MQLLRLLFLLTAGMLFTSARPVVRSKTQEAVYVYICDSKESVAYHNSKTCRGLQKCTHEVFTVTKEDAESKYGRRACKICY